MKKMELAGSTGTLKQSQRQFCKAAANFLQHAVITRAALDSSECALISAQ